MSVVHSRYSWMVGLECRQSDQQSQDDTFESESNAFYNYSGTTGTVLGKLGFLVT